MDRYITIKLIRSELIYEINLSAYAVGETIRGEDDDRSLVMDICDDGKADKTTQTLNKAWGDLLNDMTGYTKIETDEDMDVDNTFVSPEEYTARLCVPDSFSKLNVEAVKNAMHAYLVNEALAGWFAVTKKDEVAYYENKALMELAKVKRFLNVRVKPVRIKMYPF